MTRAGAHDVPAAGRAGSSLRSASVRWRIGPRAARAAFSVTSESVFLVLRLHEQAGGAWHGEVLLDTGTSEPSVLRDARPAVRWLRDEERGLMHMDAGSFLHATIDVSGEGQVLLYARTDMLGEFDLGGGRYEPAGAEIGDPACPRAR